MTGTSQERTVTSGRFCKWILFVQQQNYPPQVYELGLLSGQKQRRKLDPGMILEFPHKSVQEFMASRSALRRLEQALRASPRADNNPMPFIQGIRSTSELYNWQLFIQFMCGQGAKAETDFVVHRAAEKCIEVHETAQTRSNNMLIPFVQDFLVKLVHESKGRTSFRHFKDLVLADRMQRQSQRPDILISVVQESLAYCNKAYLSHKCVNYKIPKTLRFVPRLVSISPLMDVTTAQETAQMMTSLPSLTPREDSPSTSLEMMGKTPTHGSAPSLR